MINEGVAVAAVGVAVVETLRIYRETAPSLAEIRRAVPGDYIVRQLILDADMLGLIVVAAIGGGGAFLTRRFYPILLTGMTLVLISTYYRMVLNSSNEGM